MYDLPETNGKEEGFGEESDYDSEYTYTNCSEYEDVNSASGRGSLGGKSSDSSSAKIKKSISNDVCMLAVHTAH